MLYAITSYFNPARYASRRNNYLTFREHLNRQGVPCIAVGLGGSEMPATEIAVRDGATLWQKERLLNIALERLPSDYTAVAWLDCDIVFTNPKWVEDTMNALADFPLVQPFDHVIRLPKLGNSVGVSQRSRGFAFAMNFLGYDDKGSSLQLRFGDSGFAWAARREVLEGGLYDAAVLGGGDLACLHASVGDFERYMSANEFGERQRAHYLEWAVPFWLKVRRRITHIAGDILHLYHGSSLRRAYERRHRILVENHFDPYTDIRVGAEGTWEWASDKPRLQWEVANYFSERKEDE